MEKSTSHSAVPHAQGLRQSFVGTVIKTAMKDTATVRVDRYVKAPKYKKYRVRSKNYLAHNPGDVAQVGDVVTIVASRPISKMKHFVIASREAVSETN